MKSISVLHIETLFFRCVSDPCPIISFKIRCCLPLTLLSQITYLRQPGSDQVAISDSSTSFSPLLPSTRGVLLLPAYRTLPHHSQEELTRNPDKSWAAEGLVCVHLGQPYRVGKPYYRQRDIKIEKKLQSRSTFLPIWGTWFEFRLTFIDVIEDIWGFVLGWGWYRFQLWFRFKHKSAIIYLSQAGIFKCLYL